MKKIMLCVLTMMFVSVLTVGFATQQKTIDGSTDPGTELFWVGLGNKTAPNNFGYSATTNNAGGAVGEIGGYQERSPIADYSDTHIGTLTPATDNLTVNFKFFATGGNPSFGYFNAANWAASPADDPYKMASQLVISLDGPDVYFWGEGGRNAVGTVARDQANTGVLTYTASTHVVSFTINGGTPLTATINLSGDVYDRFGIRNLGQSSGNSCSFWVDDLSYTIGSDVQVPAELTSFSAE